MSNVLIWDTETDGLLKQLTKLHCLVSGDEVGNILFDPGGPQADFAEALRALEEADEIIGHNIVRFDIPALKKLFPWFNPKGKITDTIIMSKLIWPNLADMDFPNWRAGKIPPGIIGQHRLEAWGYRLGILKDEYDGDPDEPDIKKRKDEKWLRWNPTMHSYMKQDYRTTLAFWDRIKLRKSRVPEWSVKLEHDVARIIFRQEQFGVGFNVDKAHALTATLTAKRAEIAIKLQEVFPPWDDSEWFTPKVNNKKLGYEKGVPFKKEKWTEFQASNRFHIARAFREHLGWEPTDLNEDGSAKTDEETLSLLPWPEAKLVVEYLVLSKLLGYVANGKEAWLRHVTPEGRIHGGVDSVGAHTFRMTHSKPNLGQVPSNDSAFGKECRELFEPPVINGVQWVQVGIDADALEGRVMGHYMAPYDGGAFIKIILEGRKEDGTDLHTLNCRSIGRDPKELYRRGAMMLPGRDTAKEFFYAGVYGAMGETLGNILGVTGPKTMNKRGKLVDLAARKAGEVAWEKLLKGLPAFAKLRDATQTEWKIHKQLSAIDGRPLYPRSLNAALNTLFQSAGAIAMKVALVILDGALQAAGHVPGEDYEFMLNVHDEWQIACRPEIAEAVKQAGKDAIAKAGEVLNLKCPLVGSSSGPGTSWKDTH